MTRGLAWNAGVMVLHLPAFRAELPAMLRFAEEHGFKFKASLHDQGALRGCEVMRGWAGVWVGVGWGAVARGGAGLGAWAGEGEGLAWTGEVGRAGLYMGGMEEREKGRHMRVQIPGRGRFAGLGRVSADAAFVEGPGCMHAFLVGDSDCDLRYSLGSDAGPTPAALLLASQVCFCQLLLVGRPLPPSLIPLPAGPAAPLPRRPGAAILLGLQQEPARPARQAGLEGLLGQRPPGHAAALARRQAAALPALLFGAPPPA